MTAQTPGARVKKLEKALRTIVEMHSCECEQLAFRADCTHHIAADALRRDDLQASGNCRMTERVKITCDLCGKDLCWIDVMGTIQEALCDKCHSAEQADSQSDAKGYPQ